MAASQEGVSCISVQGGRPARAGVTGAPRGRAAGGTHWSSFWRELTPDLVREAQALGLKVLAWTVNEREAMARLLDMGIDGLVTDRPDIAIGLLRERGIAW